MNYIGDGDIMTSAESAQKHETFEKIVFNALKDHYDNQPQSDNLRIVREAPFRGRRIDIAIFVATDPVPVAIFEVKSTSRSIALGRQQLVDLTRLAEIDDTLAYVAYPAPGSDDRTIRFLETKTQKILFRPEEAAESIANLPDAAALVSLSEDRAARQIETLSNKTKILRALCWIISPIIPLLNHH